MIGLVVVIVRTLAASVLVCGIAVMVVVLAGGTVIMATIGICFS